MFSQGEVNWAEIEKAGRPKPVGISILTWLHLLGGVLLVVAVVVLFVKRTDVANNVEEIGLSTISIIFGMAFIAALAVGSGIGMLLAKTWGWWLAGCYYSSSIFRNANTCYMVSQMADQIAAEGGHGPYYYYFKFGGRVVVHLLIFLYLFKSNVLSFFNLGAANRVKLFGGLILFLVLQIALTTLLTRF